MRRQARLAHDFAAALEGRGVAGAQRDPALAPLLSLAQGLQSLPLGPAGDFRAALRTRLLAVAAVSPAEAPATSPWERARAWVDTWKVQKAIATAAAGVLAVTTIGGLTIATSRSVPGDPMYGVKRSAESLQISLARNSVNRGKRHLQHAATRLHEIRTIVGTDLALAPAPATPGGITIAFGGSRSTRVESALHAMDAETRSGSTLLFKAYTEAQDQRLLTFVREFTAQQQSGLQHVLDALPTAAHDDAEASLTLVTGLNMRAAQLLAVGTCGDACAPAQPAPGPSSTVAPQPQPTASPSYDDLGPVPGGGSGTPSQQPAPQPTPTGSPQPTATPTPTGNPSPTPSPTGSHYPLPSQVPAPVASVLQPILDEVDKTLPTPLPTPPVPPVAEPVVPATAPQP